MMAEKAPLSSVPLFSVPQIDLSKVNPTGVGTDPNITADYKNLLENQKRYADELERRYEQPNWFKIAAGFAKPQLGGFLASVGSASQALGEQTELARAIAPTIAQMRAETAKGNIALSQGKKAAGIAEQAISENRIMNPQESSAVASLTGGPSQAAAAGQNIASAQTNQLVTLLAEGRSYTDIIARLPKQFVDQNIGTVLKMYPTLQPPPGMPGSTSVTPSPATGTSNADLVAPVPGVPKSVSSNMPLVAQLKAQESNVEAAQEVREKVNGVLTQQATTAVPIFDVSTNLYKAASNPSLAGAFGIFEKGDPLSIIGKAVESGSFPNVIANMRQYITQSRLGADEKKRAISDLQAMEGALADLKTKMNNGVINPTDARTMFETESIPGVTSTQDAFLRGIARIGSDALSRYESKLAFDKALTDENFDARSWGSSRYFRDVQENAKKRTQALITNPASVQMPKFMQSGLNGAYQVGSEKSEAKPQAGGTKERPSERIIGGKTWVRQPDGSYEPKVK
jgi:hypothetical protein